MCTYLGTGSLINDQDIIHNNIINHKICYLEGYLWDNKNAKAAMKKMVENKKIRISMGKEGRMIIKKKFLLENTAKDLVNLYKNS